ncbi:MAG: hypothetical protein NC131_07350 [Roseburia sp.]|nr:hypothetical protein [Roseburia sp.]
MTFKISRAVRGKSNGVCRDAIETIGELHETWAVCPNDGFRRRWYIYAESTHLGMNNVSDCRSIAEYEIEYINGAIGELGDWRITRIK